MSKVKTFEKVKDSKFYLRDDVKSILKWTTFHRLLSISILLLSAKYMQHFDSSASLQLILDKESKNGLLRQYAFSTLRWDILHFLGVASPRPLPLSDQINPFIPIQQQLWSPLKGSGGGLQYENSIAFQPGIIWILRLTGYPLSMLQKIGQEKVESWNPIHSLCITSTLATIVSIVLPIQFYILTSLLTKNRRLARASSFLSIFSFAPATLITPTPEPFFAFFALIGHLCLAISSSQDDKKRFTSLALFTFGASISFGMAVAFRANGILLAGFTIWHLLWLEDITPSSIIWRTLWSLFLATITVMPFILTQTWAYTRICINSVESARPWCNGKLVIPYNFIQSHYWNVGPFRYWTLTQLPNWILASPVLFLIARWLASYYKADIHLVIRRTLLPFKVTQKMFAKKPTEPNSEHSPTTDTRNLTISIRSAPQLLPYAHYSLILFLILIISSHVQIALRFATQGALPVVWWSAAELFEKRSIFIHGKFSMNALLIFSLAWQTISIVLYAGFYPPA